MKRAISDRVRSARRAAGLSQEELAEAIDRTSATISNLERGKYTPSLVTLERIARALGKPLSTFVEVEEFEGASPERIERELRARALLRGFDDPAVTQALAHLEAINSHLDRSEARSGARASSRGGSRKGGKLKFS